MEIIGRYLILIVIGVLPIELGGYTVDTWQWWATCIPLWGAIALRDIYTTMHNDRG